MKKIILMLAVMICFGNALPAQAEAGGSFNEQSYNKVTMLSGAIEAFRKVSAEGELSTLATKVAAIQAKAADLAHYNTAAEAQNDSGYSAAAQALKTAATKLEAVSKKMAEAAKADDDMLFVSYQKEYNSSVNEFNNAIKTYATATEKATERIRFEQMVVIGLAVLAGIVTVAFWFWASAGDERHKARAWPRKLVAIASLLPFVGALAAVALYLFGIVTGGFMLWLPAIIGAFVLIVVWVIYFIRRRQFTKFGK
ncbi:MAG TPA: hypothetical protein VFZ58_00060 [Candidatus Saccharimonadales bacterium]